MNEFWIGLTTGVLKNTVPLLLAALGGLLSERSGIIQIALEGKMLFGALIGAIVATLFQSAEWGFLAGGLAGAALALLMAFFCIRLKSDQIIIGTGINMLAFGLAPFMTKLFFNSSGSTPNLAIDVRFTIAPIYFSILALFVITYLFYWTPWGLKLRFCGEKPEALLAAGHSVSQIQWRAMAIAGMLTGFAGASLSLFLASNFAPQMTAGRGFIALAALILGGWRPLPVAFACLLFATFDTMPLILQTFEIAIPNQFIQITPYLITLITVAGFWKSNPAPAALGHRQFFKE